MENTPSARISLAVTVIAIQVLILNHVHIFGYATPLVCAYVIMTFPSNMPKYSKLLWGFGIGAVQDAFANTPGAMVATLTFMALIQGTLLSFFGKQDGDDEDTAPSTRTLGTYFFLRYAAVTVFIQTTVFYLIMTFNFFNPVDTAINIMGSSVLSFLIIWFMESIRSSSRK